jgi:hypothetical protein
MGLTQPVPARWSPRTSPPPARFAFPAPARDEEQRRCRCRATVGVLLAITTRGGSHHRTRANIAEAARRAIPLRAGIIDLREGQRVSGALAQLAGLGVADTGVDRLRQVGRGQRDADASVDELCGKCATGVLAISPGGTVWPCVFTR